MPTERQAKKWEKKSTGLQAKIFQKREPKFAYNAEFARRATAGLKKYPGLKNIHVLGLSAIENRYKNKSAETLKDIKKALFAITYGDPNSLRRGRNWKARETILELFDTVLAKKSQEEETAAKDAKAQSQGYENWQEADAVNMVKFEWYSKVYQLVRADGGSDLDVLSIPALEAAEKQLFGITSYDARKAGQEPNLLTPSQVQQVLRGEQLQLEQAKQEIAQVKEEKDDRNKLLIGGGIVVGVGVLALVLWKGLK